VSIILTPAATVQDLIFLCMGGSEMWKTMAKATMIGLLFSTILILGAVLVLYATFYKVKYQCICLNQNICFFPDTPYVFYLAGDIIRSGCINSQ